MKRMWDRWAVVLTATCVTFALANSATATNVLSNLTRPVRGPDPIPYIGSALANAFVTGSSDPLLLDSVTLDAEIAPGNALEVNICNDIGGRIGDIVLGTWTQQQAGHGNDDYRFTGAAISLAPGTPYWLVVSPLAGQSGAWYWTEDSSSDSPYGWGVGAHAYNGFGSWHYFGIEPYEFALDATVVPEPTTLQMAAVSLLVAGGFALRWHLNHKMRRTS